MLKEAVASKAAKLMMTCVCPVAGTTALTLGVPQVRDAVHKAVQPRQYAKPKTRIRQTETAATQVASADGCPSVTPFAISDMPNEVAITSPVVGPSVANALSQATGGSSQAVIGAQQLGEVPQPDSGEQLTQRIFIPRTGGVQRTDGTSIANPSSSPDTSAWVQLVLGFGLIGVPRITYRRNGTQKG